MFETSHDTSMITDGNRKKIGGNGRQMVSIPTVSKLRLVGVGL